MLNTHLAPCPLTHCLDFHPGSPPHVWLPPSPHHWHPLPATQTQRSGFWAQTCHWCSDWTRWAQPEKTYERWWEMAITTHFYIKHSGGWVHAAHLYSPGSTGSALSDVEEASAAGLRLSTFAWCSSTVDNHGFALEQAHQVWRFLTLSHSHLWTSGQKLLALQYLHKLWLKYIKWWDQIIGPWPECVCTFHNTPASSFLYDLRISWQSFLCFTLSSSL